MIIAKQIPKNTIATKNNELSFGLIDIHIITAQISIIGARVVKAYVREDYEVKKFEKAADNVYKLFVKAESILSCNMPVMMLSVYACILGLSWFGAKMIVGGALTTGQLVSLFSYIMNIMISLMMLSMVFVMITMSKANIQA